MSRYVNIDAIIASHTTEDYRTSKISFAEVLQAPSIDIVQCKVCKHWTSDGGALMGCGLTEFVTSGDDFCSYGEREGEE